MLKSHCTICGKFLREISKQELANLSTEDICPACQDKITTILSDISKASKNFHNEVDLHFRQAKEAFEKFMELNKRMHAQVDIIVRGVENEIEEHIRQILQREKQSKKKQ